MAEKQQQKAGDQSTNVQAGAIIVQGVSYDDARQIALDLYEANFARLAEQAADIARSRVESIIDRFLADLAERHPAGLESAYDPDMQYALLTAQRAYARSGDDDLQDILVDLLVERTKERDRSILQIVLNESIEVVAKLTTAQLAVLSTVFLLHYTRWENLASLDDFRTTLTRAICPFVPMLTDSATCYRHIEYVGCGTKGPRDIGAIYVAQVFKRRYPGMFSQGFTEDDIGLLPTDPASVREMLIPCFHDPTKLQVNGIDDAAINRRAKDLGLDNQSLRALHQLHVSSQMNDSTAQKVLVDLVPCFAQLNAVWLNAAMSSLTLTSVGIAIAHANVRRVTGDDSDLSIWIN